MSATEGEVEVGNPTSLPTRQAATSPTPPLDFTFITGEGGAAKDLYELLGSLALDTFVEDAVAPLGSEADYVSTPRDESLKVLERASVRSKAVATVKDPLVLLVEVHDREEDRVKSAEAARREQWLAKHPPKARTPLYDPTYIAQQQAMTMARFPDTGAPSPRSPYSQGGGGVGLPSPSSPHSRQAPRSPHHHAQHTNSPPMGMGFLPPPPSPPPHHSRPGTRQQQQHFPGGGPSGVLDGAPPYWPTGNLPLDSSTPEVYRDPEVDRQETLKIAALRESLKDSSVLSVERAYAPQRIPDPGW
jgi:hypothetical protein